MQRSLRACPNQTMAHSHLECHKLMSQAAVGVAYTALGVLVTSGQGGFVRGQGRQSGKQLGNVTFASIFSFPRFGTGAKHLPAVHHSTFVDGIDADCPRVTVILAGRRFGGSLWVAGIVAAAQVSVS
jgi:hypothetical protein